MGQVLAEYFIGANKFIGGSSPSIADMAIAPTLYFPLRVGAESVPSTERFRTFRSCSLRLYQFPNAIICYF